METVLTTGENSWSSHAYCERLSCYSKMVKTNWVIQLLIKKISFLFKIKGALRFATAVKDAVYNALFEGKEHQFEKRVNFFGFQKIP